MKKTEAIALVLLIAVAIVMMINRFGFCYPDSYHYMQMVDNWLGRGIEDNATTPFLFRILVPWLSVPLAMIIPSEYAISIVSGIGAVLLVEEEAEW